MRISDFGSVRAASRPSYDDLSNRVRSRVHRIFDLVKTGRRERAKEGGRDLDAAIGRQLGIKEKRRKKRKEKRSKSRVRERP